MIKKALIATMMMTIFSLPVFAFQTSYEPESENAVSYTTFDDLKSWQTGFVNYAKSDGTNEYWIRVSVKIKKEKVLHYCTLVIDGQKYTLYAIEPQYKHLRAGSAPFYDIHTDTLADDFRVFASDSVYFPLSTELVNKLLTAKDVRFEFNRIRRLHNHAKVPDDMLAALQKNYQLKYADFNRYWDPKNQDGSQD